MEILIVQNDTKISIVQKILILGINEKHFEPANSKDLEISIYTHSIFMDCIQKTIDYKIFTFI